ncbi:MAG: MFS transporter [Streptosporangiaceae bacterium]|nr:MFS transporter [Streptosporangiaceae bacterium]
MSTLTQARAASQHDGADAPARLLSLPLALTFLAEFTSLTSFFLLLSVLPMLAAAAGVSSSGAGLITGSLLLGTVVAEAAAAPGIRRFGYRTMIAAGAVLLGAPALALMSREPQAVMMCVSFVRGLGFGLCGVTTGALTATLLPPGRRGEGLGLLGIVSGIPAVVALPAGVWLAGHHLGAAVAGMAAAAGVAPLIAIRWLPGAGAAHSTQQAARTRRTPGAGVRIALIFAAGTIAAGVIDSFLPLAKGVPSSLASAALLTSAITATLSRWQAGRHGDRYGHVRLLIPALIVAAAGMTAMLWLASPVPLFAGMALFGAGFGVLENATFALLLDQLPEAKASALWNFAYDAGYGAGPAVFGLFAARTGYPAAFALTGILVLAALPAAMRERKLRPRRYHSTGSAVRPPVSAPVRSGSCPAGTVSRMAGKRAGSWAKTARSSMRASGAPMQ